MMSVVILGEIKTDNYLVCVASNTKQKMQYFDAVSNKLQTEIFSAALESPCQYCAHSSFAFIFVFVKSQ